MIDLEAVSEVTGLFESTIQSLIRADEFPKPRKASARRSCWLLREIEEWAERVLFPIYCHPQIRQ